MNYLKCFKKQINIALYLIIFILGVITIIWGFTNELFEFDTFKNRLTSLQIFDRETIRGSEIDTSYTLQGLIEFTSRVINNATNPELVKYNVILTDEIISSCKTILTFVIVMFVSYAIFALGQIFNFRNYTNIASTLIMLVSVIIIKNVALNNLVEIEFIARLTNAVTTIIVLSAIAFGLSVLQIGFNFYLKHQNSIK